MIDDRNDMMAAYLEGRLNADQVAELESYLREDRERTRAFVRQAMLDCHLVALHHEENIEHIASDLSDDSHFGAILKSLEAPDDSVELVDITNQIKYEQAAKRALEAEQQRLLNERLLNERRVSDKGRKLIIIPKSLFYGGIAAMLLIAVAVLWPRPEAPAPSNVALDTPATTTSSLAVATITSSAKAQWRWGERAVDLPVGTALRQWDRLTLTHGFAELTTERGATVLLEAPCTFEMTGSDNALRLHSGKLVGKCLTPQSKGFIVHAPGIDVVDLGTEFGVQADQTMGSTVLVMDGEVRAQPTFESPKAFEPVVLQANQARRVKPQTGALEMIAVSEAPAFHQDKPHPYVTAVLDAAPVAYWRFEDERGRVIKNTVADDFGDLEMVGPATLTKDGVIGSAGRLVNRGKPYGYFETLEPIQSLTNLDSYTVELWYYTDEQYSMASDNAIGTLLNWYNPSQKLEDNRAWESVVLELGNDFWQERNNLIKPIGWRKNALRLYPPFIEEGEQKREVYTATDYPVRKWQHVVLVQNNGSVSLYLDGRLVESAPYGFPAISSPVIRLGRSIIGEVGDTDLASVYEPKQNDHRSLRGRLDEVAIYDKPLTAAQIAEHHALATQNEDGP